MFHLSLLGTLTLKIGEEEKTSFSTRKVGHLLAYLGLDPGRPIPRESLRNLFWPEADEANGRNSLSVSLNRLRSDLGDPTLLTSDRWTVSLDGERIDSDVRRFRAYLRGVAVAHTETARMAQAIRVLQEYRGPFLPACEDPWAVGERISLAESHHRAIETLMDYVERHGDLNGSVDQLRGALPLLPAYRQSSMTARLEKIRRSLPEKDDRRFARTAQPRSAEIPGAGGWNAAHDFSPIYNPNGPWSYGWSWSEEGPMQPATFGDFLWSGEVSVPLWRAAMYTYPCVVKNEAKEPFNYETLTIPPGSLMMHPGPVSQVAVLRWTTPNAGLFNVRLRVHVISPEATTGIYLNSSQGRLWRHEYRAAVQPEAEFQDTIELAEGEWIEVRVDDGGDDYIADSTGIDLSVNQV